MRALLIFAFFLFVAAPGFRYWAKHMKEAKHRKAEPTSTQCTYRFADGTRCTHGRMPLAKFCIDHGGVAQMRGFTK